MSVGGKRKPFKKQLLGKNCIAEIEGNKSNTLCYSSCKILFTASCKFTGCILYLHVFFAGGVCGCIDKQLFVNNKTCGYNISKDKRSLCIQNFYQTNKFS